MCLNYRPWRAHPHAPPSSPAFSSAFGGCDPSQMANSARAKSSPAIVPLTAPLSDHGGRHGALGADYQGVGLRRRAMTTGSPSAPGRASLQDLVEEPIPVGHWSNGPIADAWKDGMLWF